MDNYRQIDLSAWTKTGEGGNGSTYENPEHPEVLLKVNKAGLNSLETVKSEYDLSTSVAALGISTPGMHEIVRVGDAYATIMERIKNKKSIFRICHDEPGRIEEMARLFCKLGKELWATPCNASAFPARKKTALEGLEASSYFGKKNIEILRAFINAVPEGTGCVHGDFQPGNVIVSGDKYYWIDLGRFSWGNPMFDIGHLYLSCIVYAPQKQTQDIFHMNESQLNLFWDAFATAYTGKKDHAEFDREAARFGAVDMAMRTYYQKPSILLKIYFRVLMRRLIKNFDK